MVRMLQRAALMLAAGLLAAYATGAALIRWSPDRFIDFPEPEIR